MSEEIKPCPFCGSNEVEQFKKVNQIHDVKLFGYCCWNCGAESGISGIEEEAIQKWNKRPYDYDMPAIVKKVQQLEKENEQLKKMLELGVNYEWANS
jgi:Lar family restriction alleviation protein